MGFNFPNAPTIGQLHPDPAVVGIPQYQWNGNEWVTPAYNPLDYVRKSGDTMTGALVLPGNATTALQAVPKQQLEVYAAPLDALAYSGMQINGAIEVNQDLGMDVQTGVSGGVICDGFRIYKAGTMAYLASSTLAAPITPGIRGAIGVSITVAQPSLGANDYCVIQHPIEGYTSNRLAWGTANAKPITIAFWSKHTRTGVYSIAVHNLAGTRSYCTTYTQAVSNVGQYNIVTVPGCTDGVWETTTSPGIVVAFSMGSGANFTAPVANAWQNGAFNAAPGHVNAVAATTDAFRFSGLLVLPGIYAPTAEQQPLIMRPYGQELAVCKRYFDKITATVPGALFASGLIYSATLAIFFFLARKMRVDPTVTIRNALSDFNIVYGNGQLAPDGVSVVSVTEAVRIDFTVSAGGMPIGSGAALMAVNSNAGIKLDARM